MENETEKEIFDAFYKWMESPEEKELWFGNYNNATRDEYVARRAWNHQQQIIVGLINNIKELEECASEWMERCDALKEKYEPKIINTSQL